MTRPTPNINLQVPLGLMIAQRECKIRWFMALLNNEPKDRITKTSRELSERIQVLIKERNALRTRQQIERIEQERRIA